MAKEIDFRVALDPKVHLGLEVLAAQKHTTMRELASAIIWQGIGPAARSFAEQSGVRGEEMPEVIVTQGDVDISPKIQDSNKATCPFDDSPKGGLDEGCRTSTDADLISSDQSGPESEPHPIAHSSSPEGRKLQLRISKNPPVQAQIKELWETTDLTREEISKRVHYPRATVQKWIITCLEITR